MMTDPRYTKTGYVAYTGKTCIVDVIPDKRYTCYRQGDSRVFILDEDDDVRFVDDVGMSYEYTGSMQDNTEQPQEHTMSTQQLMEAIEQAHSHLMKATKTAESVHAQKHLDELRGILQERAKQ